ncbi:hypothetical protein WL32_17825 [Burkholderia cepacia]|nr:hypothetical protein [Burkholderia cepacia]KWB20510.1 hypothetical protein WL32_17825 [Burkholderia cepacia]
MSSSIVSIHARWWSSRSRRRFPVLTCNAWTPIACADHVGHDVVTNDDSALCDRTELAQRGFEKHRGRLAYHRRARAGAGFQPDHECAEIAPQVIHVEPDFQPSVNAH